MTAINKQSAAHGGRNTDRNYEVKSQQSNATNGLPACEGLCDARYLCPRSLTQCWGRSGGGGVVEFKVAASSQRRASRVKGRQMGGPVATCRSASMTLNRRSRCASDRQADARDANTPDRTRLERGWVMVEERVGDVEGAS